jgi:hypothetical protein
MKRFLIRGGLILAALFVILFLLRLGYGYLSHPSGDQSISSNGWNYSNSFGNNFQAENLERKNYASAKMKSGSGTAPDQKYEKVGTLVTRTENFSDDEKQLRDLIVKYKALIQSEQRFGLPGNQNLQLGIGVIPDKFDDMVKDCRAIGKTLSLQINKTDKTNEYKDLQAKKTSLVQTRDALTGLKSRGGKIDELMELENRILQIEEQIQGLGVRLGEYDAENEFCTVKLTLSESGKIPGIPFAQRLKVAFEWTVAVYAGLMMTAFFGILSLSLLAWLTPRVIALAKHWKLA